MPPPSNGWGHYSWDVENDRIRGLTDVSVEPDTAPVGPLNEETERWRTGEARYAYDELVHVRVLAADVLRVDADTAFRRNAPSSYEEAELIASRIPRAAL